MSLPTGYTGGSPSGHTDESWQAYNKKYTTDMEHKYGLGSEFENWYNQAMETLRKHGLDNQAVSLSDYQYSPSFWSKIKSLAGDDSDQTNFWNNARNSIRENINGLLAQIENRDYNSPLSQADRLKAAGINPALQEGSVTSGNSEIPTDMTPDVVPQAETTSAGDFLDVVTSPFRMLSSAGDILQSGISISTAVEELAHKRVGNQLNELGELFGNIPGLNSFLANLTPSEDWTDPATGALVKAGTPLQAAQVSAYVDSLGLRKGTAKLLKQLAGRARYDKNGNPTTGYTAALNKLTAQSLEDAQKSVEVMSSPGFQQNLTAWSAKYNALIGSTNEEILKATQEAKMNIARYDAKMHDATATDKTYEAMLAGEDASAALSQFNEEYYNKLDPEARSSMENNEARARFIAAETQKMNERIVQAQKSHYANAIQSVKDMNLPKDQEDALLSGIYEQYNQFLADLARVQAEEVTKGNKTIGESDWLGLGSGLLGTGVDLYGKMKGKGKPAGKSYVR